MLPIWPRALAESPPYRAAQSNGLIRPNVVMGGSATRTDATIADTHRDTSSRQLALNARQPLFSRANDATVEKLRRSLDASLAELQLAEQDLLVVRDFEGVAFTRVVTPLMRLQDPDYTRIVLVTLPETTPVSEAAALQEDLRRARIEPFAWVINRSLATSGTTSPVLAARIAGEVQQVRRVAGSLAKRTFVVPWRQELPVGLQALRQLDEEQTSA